MSVRLEHLKETEGRIKASLTSTLTSIFVLLGVMILIILIGVVMAQR